jgi:hypothetical protein
MSSEGFSQLEVVGQLVRSMEMSAKLQNAPTSGQRPVADSLNSAVQHLLDLGGAARVAFGVIVDSVPSARVYRVLPTDGMPVLQCTFAPHGTMTDIGAYDATTLTPGTNVWFIKPQNSADGIIIACDPQPATDPTVNISDWISLGSNTGLHAEPGLRVPLSLGGNLGSWPLNGGVAAYTGRTPMDSLEVGEYNRTTETGLMLHMDSYMAFMRAHETTGIWMFYWDGLLRLSGSNFEEWAGHSTREAYDDEGEHHYYHGIATYPWESMGKLTDPTTSAWEEKNVYTVQNEEPYYGPVEPAYPDLQSFCRWERYHGYLGQGEKTILSAPNFYDGTEQLQYSNFYQPVGLFDSNVTIDGRWGVRTAAGFVLMKRPIIPVPKRIEQPASSAGDIVTGDNSNYLASGYSGFGDGDPHLVQPLPLGDPEDNEHLPWHMAVNILDLHAHLFNWQGLHPFHYHANDFYLPEESAYTPITTNQEIPDWDQLDATDTWNMEPPEPVEIQIDHRTGMGASGETGDDGLKIYPNTAYIHFMDEGGVLIGDGFGSEIRMIGGSIHFECAGDVFCNAGRNVINFGGRDVILRAHESCDISANEHDVRIKAEENAQIIAGNTDSSNKGHILLDCRSSGIQYDFRTVGEGIEATGIILKATETELLSYANSMYFRTNISTSKNNGSASAPTPNKPGDIVFDTDGENDIISRGRFVKHWVSCGVVHMFPDEPSTSAVNLFTADGNTLGADLFVDGDTLVYDSLIVGDNGMCCQGHWYSDYGGQVGKLAAGMSSAVCTAINAGHNFEANLETWADNSYTTDMTNMWYQAGRPGNQTVIESMWASMRIVDNYKTDSWYMYEPRWQQLDRLNGGPTTETWTENDVASNDAGGSYPQTQPFPGQEIWTDNATKRLYQQQSLVMSSFDQANDRGADYEAMVILDTTTAVEADGNFQCISKS